MFFIDKFISLADKLDASFKGNSRPGQNPSDKGELCESFIKEFLEESLDPNLNIFRGGNIINIENKKSKQLDIIVCSGNSIRIFTDKGLYPVETAYGVFSVTSTLDKPKLESCIEEFKSIPKNNPQFLVNNGLDDKEVLTKWNNSFPYKCIFAFSGDINIKWESFLNELVDKDKSLMPLLPHMIVVNKKGAIFQVNPNGTQLAAFGEMKGKNFHFVDFEKAGGYWFPFPEILSCLYRISDWQYKVRPRYNSYFDKDIDDHYNNLRK